MASAELGQTSDPKALVPGNPDAVFDNARVLRKRAEEAATAGQALKQIDTGAWTGEASQSFHDQHQTEVPRWLQTGDCLNTAAAALEDFAHCLTWAQSQAGEAIHLWNQGQDATNQAQAAHTKAVADAQAQTQANASRSNPTVVTPPTFIDPGEAQRQAARDMLNRARQQLADVGDRTANVLSDQADLAPQDSQKQTDANFYSGIWSSFKGFGEGIWNTITDPAGTVSAMAYSVTHPVQTLKEAVDWNDWVSGHPDRALGKITGDLIIGAATFGAGKAARVLLKGDLPVELPHGAKEGWTSRPANTGKGTVWQKPGSVGDANSIRVMDPGADPRYPNGYVKYTNQYNQPINLDGKPGSRSETHIPRNPDGSYPVPKGW